MRSLKGGDTLTVWKLDRLRRFLLDLIAMLDELKVAGVAPQSLTETIGTETPTDRSVWQMIGILAELERSLKKERAQAGRAAAMAGGVKMGRKGILSDQQIAHARKLLEQNEAPKQVAETFKVSIRTLYRVIWRKFLGPRFYLTRLSDGVTRVIT